MVFRRHSVTGLTRRAALSLASASTRNSGGTFPRSPFSINFKRVLGRMLSISQDLLPYFSMYSSALESFRLTGREGGLSRLICSMVIAKRWNLIARVWSISSRATSWMSKPEGSKSPRYKTNVTHFFLALSRALRYMDKLAKPLRTWIPSLYLAANFPMKLLIVSFSTQTSMRG